MLREVVKITRDPKAQKLSQTYHSILVQRSLLEHEAQGLKQALINERLHRKRGKAPALESPEEYHGKAVFWSPKKVKEPDDRLQQQELEEEHRQLQKAEQQGNIRRGSRLRLRLSGKAPGKGGGKDIEGEGEG